MSLRITITEARLRAILDGLTPSKDEVAHMAALILDRWYRAPIEARDPFERHRGTWSWAVVLGRPNPRTSLDVWVTRSPTAPGSSEPVQVGARTLPLALGVTQPTRGQARILRDRLIDQLGLRRVNARELWDYD